MSFIASLVSVIVLWVAQPTRLRCPDGWGVEGVRRDGTSVCRLPAPETPESDCSGAKRCNGGDPDLFRITVRIYCSGGLRPLALDDGRTIACGRGKEQW